MRFCVFVIVVSFFVPAVLCAQTASGPRALSILTSDQQLEYAKARAKALADDPALNAENDALKQQFADVIAHGTPAEKQAILEKVAAHRQRLRQAMLKEDPNLGPIFAQIDKSISQLEAKSAPGN